MHQRMAVLEDDDDPRPAAGVIRAAKSKRQVFRGFSGKVLLGLLFVLAMAALTLAGMTTVHQTSVNSPAHFGIPLPEMENRKLQVPGAQYFKASSRITAANPTISAAKHVANMCTGVLEREPPSCIAMPPQHALRIAIAALPPEAYLKKAPSSANLAAAPIGDAAWLDSAFRAAWDFATSPYEQWSPLDFEHAPPTLTQMRDALMSVNIPDDVEHPPPDRSAPILNTGRLKQAVGLARSRLARLASMKPAFTFTSQSQRDLERIVIANILSSPYATMVDLRATTMQELQQFDLVFVPFPLIAMRDNPKLALRFQDIMTRFVPTLTIDPARHLFIFGRLFRDTALLPSFRKSFRSLVSAPPLNQARYMTTQPYDAGETLALPTLLITLPYPSLARAAITGWEDPDEIDSRNLPWSTVTPANLGGQLSPCEPLCVGDAEFQARNSDAQKRCTRSDAMEAIMATRPLLVSFIGEPRDKQPERAAALKQMRACDQCAVFDLGSDGLASGGGAYGMAWVYSMSVFCVHPHGDAPPRKAFFDGLSVGCIPVVLSRDEADVKLRARAPLLPFPEKIPYHEFVVLLSRQQWFTGLIPALRAITPAAIRSMQQAISKYAHLIQWSWPPRVLQDMQRLQRIGPPAAIPSSVEGLEGSTSSQHAAGAGVKIDAASDPDRVVDTSGDFDPMEDTVAPSSAVTLVNRPLRPFLRCALDAFDMLLITLADEAALARRKTAAAPQPKLKTAGASTSSSKGPGSL